MPEFDHAENLRRERRAASDAADRFVRACQSGDVEALRYAVALLNGISLGWTLAMRRFARVLAVSRQIQEAFLQAWVESKLGLAVGHNRALCTALWVLLPPYKGKAVRLFRGACAGERRRRIYGTSWSADIAVAERFAKPYHVVDGGSVILETLAPAASIISRIKYPKPITEDEIEQLRRDHPDVEIQEEFHEEQEYVVDCRFLNAVTVVRQYPPLQESP